MEYSYLTPEIRMNYLLNQIKMKKRQTLRKEAWYRTFVDLSILDFYGFVYLFRTCTPLSDWRILFGKKTDLEIEDLLLRFIKIHKLV